MHLMIELTLADLEDIEKRAFIIKKVGDVEVLLTIDRKSVTDALTRLRTAKEGL